MDIFELKHTWVLHDKIRFAGTYAARARVDSHDAYAVPLRRLIEVLNITRRPGV